MTIFDQLRDSFVPVHAAFLASPGLRRLAEGRIERKHYAACLRQIFHHTRENPQIQALATVYFRGAHRSEVKSFFRHALAEVGHDQLAKQDLVALGENVDQLPFENPLPETTALVSFPFYQINHLDPIGYLGYLYFLEFLPTASGEALMHALARIDIPRSAMTFLHDHSTIDLGHNRLMQRYAETLIDSPKHLQSVVHAMRVTGRLYANMIAAAFDHADAPFDWGLSSEECE